ncbi:hypothetical protein MHY1_02982 [Methylovirgula sp. HY1]|nr:hypothetical protein MHY1_02982 [Methylovirgula sp. HY1]
MLHGQRTTQPLIGLIWPKTGCASIALPQRGGSTFFPWSTTPRASLAGTPVRPFLAGPRKSRRLRPSLRCGLQAGASSIASGLTIAIEAAVVAGSKQLRRRDMATIGSFKKVNNEFQGEIVTLSVLARGVRIVPESRPMGDNAPSHRVFVGRAEIGAAWSKRSNEGRDYLSVKLDDPSFNSPIYANLFNDEDGEGFSLIWSRGRKPNGD